MESVYYYFNKHYLLRTIILFAQSIMGVFLGYFGFSLSLTTTGKELTIVGAVICAIVFLLAFIINLCNNHYSRKDIVDLEETKFKESVNKSIISSQYVVNKDRYYSLIVCNTRKDVSSYIKNPERRVIFLLAELISCMCQVFGIQKKNCKITIAYSFEMALGSG